MLRGGECAEQHGDGLQHAEGEAQHSSRKRKTPEAETEVDVVLTMCAALSITGRQHTAKARQRRGGIYFGEQSSSETLMTATRDLPS